MSEQKLIDDLVVTFANTYVKEWVKEFPMIEGEQVKKKFGDTLADFEITPLQQEKGYPSHSNVFWQMQVEENSWFLDNLAVMAACGFRIYFSEDYGYFVGVDNPLGTQPGMNAFAENWLPLYELKNGCH